MQPGVSIAVSEEFLQAVAERAAALVRQSLNERRWLYGARAAAEYLNWPVKRVYERTAAGTLPCHKDGSRLMFDTAELDRVIRG